MRVKQKLIDTVFDTPWRTGTEKYLEPEKGLVVDRDFKSFNHRINSGWKSIL